MNVYMPAYGSVEELWSEPEATCLLSPHDAALVRWEQCSLDALRARAMVEDFRGHNVDIERQWAVQMALDMAAASTARTRFFLGGRK